MSEQTMEEEQVPNPYNMKKSWHKADGKRMPQADELYYEDEVPESAKATRQSKKSAPEDDSSTTTHNYKKRYDDLKRRYDQKIGEFKQKELDFENQLNSMQPAYETPKSEEEIQQFRESNPDLYDTFESVAHNIAADQISSLQPRLSAIDLYKLETGKGQRSKQRRSNRQQPNTRSAADMVSTKTTNVEPKQQKIWTESEIAKMSLDQFDKYEDDIRQAIDEGRVRAG